MSDSPVSPVPPPQTIAISDDATTVSRTPCPEAHANLFSRLFMGWTFPLILQGWRNPLEDKHLWELRDFERASFTSTALLSNFRRVCEEGKQKKLLMTAIVRAFRTPLIITACLKGFDVLFFILIPVFINRFIRFLQSDRPNRIGVLWALALLLVPLLKTIIENQYFALAMRIGLRVRSSLQAILYDKSLRMSPTARASSSLGELVNLMQLDSQRIGDFAQLANVLWAAPIQIIVTVALLYHYIGVSAIIGLLATLLAIPFQGFLIAKQAALRKSSLTLVDKRVKLSNEILQGIKAVKFYAWESPFSGQVLESRAQEVKKLYKGVWIKSAIIAFLMSVPVLIGVITFAFYTGVFKQSLDPARIFTGIALLNQLRVPVMMLPMVITQFIDTRLGLGRIERFLNLENTDDYAREKSKQASTTPSDDEATPATSDSSAIVAVRGSVSIKNGEFEWSQIASNPFTVKKQPGKKILGCIPRRKTKKGEKLDAPSSKDDSLAQASQTQNSENGDTNSAGPEDNHYTSLRGSVLRNVNIDFQPGKLTAIVGHVGSGKSSLLHAILGEMRKKSGEVVLDGSVGYVAQTAWILNNTLKNNILFGKEFNQEAYDKAISVSALEQDIDMLPAGDLTAIGEKGINLSGGQKQRVSIARAVYSDSDVYIFDDPLSALDAHVSRQVFDECISNSGVLSDRLRILVTNQVHVLPECDNIVFLHSGSVRCQGTYQELAASDSAFQSLISEQEKAAEEAENEDEDATTSKADETEGAPDLKSAGEGELKKAKMGTVGRVLMQTEDRNMGKVGVQAYIKYINDLGGMFMFFLLVVAFVATTALSLIVNWWLSYWSEEEAAVASGELASGRSLGFFLGIYFAMSVGYAVSVFWRNAWFLSLSVRASKNIHNEMLRKVLRAPMSFFDTTPIGRILSRFSRDVAALDELLPQFFQQALMTTIQLLCTYVFIGVVLPLFFAAAAPVTLFYFLLQRFFNRTAVELKRLESVSKTPIYAHFSETLGGLSTLRAYRKQEQARCENMHKIDLNQRAFFAWVVTNRWFTVLLEMSGSLLVFATAIFGVFARDRVYAGDLALVVTYATQVTQFLGFTVRSITELEGQMNSVERANYYRQELPEEAAEDEEGVTEKGWPMEGKIEMEGVKMRYREGLPLVLNGLTLTVEGGEKVGIVGRTGSGKSSMMMALLRMVELSEGQVKIDGVDLKKVGLRELRSQITIIPQDPVMFSGTIRSNLDPFGEYSDAELWGALEKSHLKGFVSEFEAKLDAPVSEYGENLSAGQRQVICLTRALLRNSKVLILDEASSSLDAETDQMMQKTIREHLREATILTIAHRLLSVADYDKVLVMQDGAAGEFGSPRELLEREAGLFRQLVEAMGSSGANHVRRLVSSGGGR